MTRYTYAALYRAKRRIRTPPDPYTRVDLFRRWSGACAYCSAPAEHVDHVKPICAGGRDVLRNVLPACADCNLDKGSLTLAEWAATF
ncbi:HNH endonuclease signature motif containing protein [Streptomyces yangpuensis]|uniref:HNH endonuclease n=1 Tax=Streptomyces yangpuensis TaxID=1648182 RepID=UPI0034462656